MIKSILVCTDGSKYGDTAVEYALDLASRLRARLLGLHVLDARVLEGPLMADVSGWLGAQPYGAEVEKFRQLLEEKGNAVLAAFMDRAARAGIKAASELKMGHPARIILQEEGRAELLVIGQRGEHAEFGGELVGSTADRVIRRTVTPCLVTPLEYRPVNRILAAYDGSGHATMALREAAEMAAALGVELMVITVTDHLESDEAQQISDNGFALAADHTERVKAVIEQGEAAAVLLEYVEKEKCDLIAVGAYGHSRIRELILGSVPTQLVAGAKVPVLITR